jgi:hypothetical protein
MTYIPGFVLFFVNLFIYMIDSDQRPLLKSASTDVIFSNHCLILGYSQIGVLSKLAYIYRPVYMIKVCRQK